jgi:hypothetical protein
MLFSVKVATGQLYGSIDSLNLTSYQQKKFIVFGEVHWRQEENAELQQKILSELINSGNKSVYFYLEVQPSAAYIMNLYLQSNDEGYIDNENIGINFREILKRLKLLRDKNVNIVIVPLDLIYDHDLNDVKFILNHTFNDTISNRYFDTEFSSLDLGSCKKIEKFVRSLNSDSLEKMTHAISNNASNGIILDQMFFAIRNYGFVKSIKKREPKKIAVIREKHFAKIVEYYSKKEGAHFATLGRFHVTPFKNMESSSFYRYLDNMNRDDFVVILRQYEDYRSIFCFYQFWDSRAEFENLIRVKAVDIVLLK